MVARFFVPPEQIQNKKFSIRGTEAHHAAVVLRKKVGDVIEMFDGKDLAFQGRIEVIASDRVEGTVLAELSRGAAPLTQVVLFQSLIKGPRWDWLVEKASELGTTKLVPLTTARTVVKPSTNGLERWRRISLAAAKQSGRPQVMDVSSPMPLSEALGLLSADTLAFIPWEKETSATIRGHFQPQRAIGLFIGPEGGWEAEEVDSARRKGVIPVTIGSTLLRSETAGLVALAQVYCELGA